MAPSHMASFFFYFSNKLLLGLGKSNISPFCDCSHPHMKGLKTRSLFLWSEWYKKIVNGRSTIFCFHNFMISGLICRSKHNNNPSDSVIVGSPYKNELLKVSFLAQLCLRLDEKLRPFSLAPVPQSVEFHLLEFRSFKSSGTSYCPFLNIHNCGLQL